MVLYRFPFLIKLSIVVGQAVIALVSCAQGYDIGHRERQYWSGIQIRDAKSVKNISIYTGADFYKFSNDTLLAIRSNKIIYPIGSQASSVTKVFELPERISAFDAVHLQDTCSIDVSADTTNFSLTECLINNLSFGSTLHFNSILNFTLTNCNISCLSIMQSSLTNDGTPLGNPLHFSGSTIGCINIGETEISGTFSIPIDSTLSTIRLQNIDFKSEKSTLDFTTIRRSNNSSPIALSLSYMGDGMSHLKLDYEYFELLFENSKLWEKEKVYKQLLDEQLKDGFTFGYEKLDKEYSKFKFTKDGSVLGEIQNWIAATWWDYGYDKFKVIKNSLKIFLLFILINLLIYPLLCEVYCPQKFNDLRDRLTLRWAHPTGKVGWKLRLATIPGVIVYTAYIFWGLKLDLKEIELKKPAVYMLIMFEYVTGLICIAYVANYVFSK